MPDSPGRLYIREAAKRAGVHENTIRNWIDSGRLAYEELPGPLQARRRNRIRRVIAADLERVMAEAENEAHGEDEHDE